MLTRSIAVAVLVVGPAVSAADAPRRPNVLLIVSDDPGYADLGCFGGRQVKTPSLDRLAREGVRATSFYVTWPACTPSRGSLLTGRYLPFNAPHSASTFDKEKLQVPEKYLRAYPDADPKSNRTKYLAMVTCMDEAVGEILDRLASLGLERDTLVLFFSDNGGARPGDNGPLRGFKTQMFEGGIRVPFLARWPAPSRRAG
jgi:arylsulfatase A-like enzyme